LLKGKLNVFNILLFRNIINREIISRNQVMNLGGPSEIMGFVCRRKTVFLVACVNGVANSIIVSAEFSTILVSSVSSRKTNFLKIQSHYGLVYDKNHTTEDLME